MEGQVQEVLSTPEQDEPSELKTLAGGLLLVNAKIELLQQQIIESLSATIREEVDRQLQPIVREMRKLVQSYHTLRHTLLERTIGLEQTLQDIQNQLVSLDGKFASHSALTQDSLAQLKDSIENLQKNIVEKDLLSHLTNIIKNMSERIKEVATKIDAAPVPDDKLGSLSAKLVSLQAMVSALKDDVEKLRWSHESSVAKFEKACADIQKALSDIQKAL